VIAFVVVVFFGIVVGGTGPAFQESEFATRLRVRLERRRARLALPRARIAYLPSASCRPAE
jgi:hypothetical protein